MSEMLNSGWWRCDCDVDCKCGTDLFVKRVHPPSDLYCARCGAVKPDVVEVELPPHRLERLERRRQRRANVG